MVTKIQQMDQKSQAELDDEGVASYKSFEEIPISTLVPSEYIVVDWPLVIPDEIMIGTLRDGRLRVQSPIKVKFTQENKDIIANAVEFNEFGFGENTSEALADLQHAIVELYFTLDKEQSRLGKDLHQIWTRLQKKIHKS